MKILWISRHAPYGVRAQMDALRGMFGDDVQVVHKDIPNAQAAAREFHQGGYTDVAAVVPMATLAHLVREGLHPLWSEMGQEPPQDGRAPDLQFRGTRFWFAGFKRVQGLSLELAPVVQDHTVLRVLRVTRHEPSNTEVRALKDAFGEGVTNTTVNIQFGRDPVATLRQEMARENAQEALVVAPYGVYDQLVKSGLRPLYAKMEGGRFVSLHRLMGVRLQLEDL